MLCHRMKQFREYNKLNCKLLAELLNITEDEYKAFESNKATPTIDIITKLSVFYKVTVDEFYGYTPRLTLHSSEDDLVFDNVSENILKMSDLSWDEAKLILAYRNSSKKEEFIKTLLDNTQKDI